MGRFRARRLPSSVAELVITLSNRHVKTQLWDRATHRVVVAAGSVEPALRYKIYQQAASTTGATTATAAAVAAAAHTPNPPPPFPGLTPPAAPTADAGASPIPPSTTTSTTPSSTPPSFAAAAHSTPPRPYDFGSYATGSVAAAGLVGATLAARATAAGVAGVVWKTHPPPRYHGKIKAVVDALLAGGVTIYSRGEPAGGPVAAHGPPVRKGVGTPVEARGEGEEGGGEAMASGERKDGGEEKERV